MRFIAAVVLAICFFGVASAGSIEKRRTPTYTQQILELVKEAIANNKTDELPSNIKLVNNAIVDTDTGAVIIRRRSTNPLELINDLGNIGTDPAKFVQDFLKVLAEMALAQGRRKRTTNPLELINDIGNPAKLAEDMLKVLADMATGQGRRKRATNPLELINDLGNIGTDPAKFAQDFLKVLAEMALAQGRRKRDLFGDLQKFGEAAQEKGQEALSNLKDTLENLLKENPFFQSVSGQFDDESDETSTDSSIVKRNVFDNFAKLGELAQEKGQEALKNLKDALENLLKENPFFQSVSGQFDDESDETSTDSSIVKRNIFGDISRFNGEVYEDVKEYFQGLFEQIKEATSNDDDVETATIAA